MLGRSLLAFATSLVLAACSQSAGTGGESPSPASAAAPPPARGFVIATVVTHDAKVNILTSAGGDLRVVVRKLDGTLVADGIPLDELRTTDPALYTVVTSARAGVIDATFDRHHLN